MKTNEFEKMKEGKLYNAAHRDLVIPHAKGLMRCDRYNRIALWRVLSKKIALQRLIPSSKGKNLAVFSPLYCEYGVNIHVGNECFMNYNCVLLDVAPITLGNSVWLGANVTLATPCHPLLAEERIFRDYPDGHHDLEYSKPITIKDNAWICSCVTVCGGVTIGENAVVAAGAVVTKDVPPNTLVAGVPAQIVRELSEDDRIDVWETYIQNEIPLSKREKEIKK